MGPPALRNALQTNGPPTLHRTMEMAVLLEPTFGKSSVPNRQPGEQNPDRVKCNTCGRWHHKDAVCKAEDIASWTKNKAGQNSNNPTRNVRGNPRYVKVLEDKEQPGEDQGDIVHQTTAPDDQIDNGNKVYPAQDFH